MAKFALRDCVQCPIFGSPKDFGPNVLPTKADVLRCCQEIRRQKGTLSNKEPAFSDIADEVRSKLIAIWVATSIPTVSEQRVKERITLLHTKYNTLQTLLRSRTATQITNDQKVASFRDDCSQLFDIAFCKCFDLLLMS